MKPALYLVLCGLWIWSMLSAPWDVATQRTGTIKYYSVEHAPVWAPPASDRPSAPSRLKLEILLVEWLAIGLVAAGVSQFHRFKLPDAFKVIGATLAGLFLYLGGIAVQLAITVVCIGVIVLSIRACSPERASIQTVAPTNAIGFQVIE